MKLEYKDGKLRQKIKLIEKDEKIRQKMKLEYKDGRIKQKFYNRNTTEWIATSYTLFK